MSILFLSNLINFQLYELVSLTYNRVAIESLFIVLYQLTQTTACMQKSYKNILIGGSGFIGFELAKKFSEKGESVLSISRHPNESYPGIDTIALDVNDSQSLEKYFPRGENVFILIGQNSINFDARQELQNLRNLVVTLNKTLPKKVFYLSSALVYGERIKPAKEDDRLVSVEKYSKFKRDAEKLLKNRLSPEIILGILRLANVYGSPKNRGFIGLVMEYLLRTSREQIIINGDGKQERDYIFVDDVISAILSVKRKLKKSDTINIATGEGHSLIELMERIAHIVGYTLPYTVNGKQLVEVIINRVSGEKLRKVYGFTPKHSFEDGLRKTLERYQTSPVFSEKKAGLRILLLGGEGFIGRNLSLYFSKTNKCYSVGRKKSAFLERADTFIQADPYKEKISNTYDVIIHLIDNKVSPDSLLKQERKLVKNVALNSDNHLIVFSSAVVYANPNSEYGRRKRKIEKFYQEYCEKQNIPLTIFRPFNSYGPFQVPYRQGSLAGNLIYNYLNQKSTEINDMDACRDFIYSQDIAKFVEYAIMSKLRGTFDIGSGKLTRIKSLISLLERKIFKDHIDIVYRGVKENIAEQQAKGDLLDSINMVGFEDGLVKTAAFYKDNLSIFKNYVD